MMFDYVTLKLIWLGLIGALFIGFVITGGYDLGVGILLPILGKNDAERRLMLKAIGPTWEGNQVWLITGAGAIFAAWPLVYATLSSALYFVWMSILLALIVRPPGIDYRNKIPSRLWRSVWDGCLFISGLAPSFLFGIIFGNICLGIPFEFDNDLRLHSTSSFDSLLTFFPCLCGILCITGFSLHAALFLQMKTDAPFQTRAQKTACCLGILFALIFIFVCLFGFFKLPGFQIHRIPNLNESFSPLMKQVIRHSYAFGLNYQHHPGAWAIPISVILSACIASGYAFIGRPGTAMIFSALALTGTLCTVGFALFPFIVPSSSQPNHSLTIWDATSSALTLTWMLWAILFFLPIILLYTTWVFRVMRGKIILQEGQNSSNAY